MIDLIVFSVDENRYAINIENIHRIIQLNKLENIPNSHSHIEGIVSYEGRVIKVLSFRKIIGLVTYEAKLIELFASLKNTHSLWMDALKISITTGVAFTKKLDPHTCGLGKWIDSFTAYDDYVMKILNELSDFHKQLHLTGAIALNKYEYDKREALDIFNDEIVNIYEHTKAVLQKFTEEVALVANSLQKLIIYDSNGLIFAIKVDNIEDIAHLEESAFIDTELEHDSNEFLELECALELQGVLTNVIKNIILPK